MDRDCWREPQQLSQGWTSGDDQVLRLHSVRQQREILRNYKRSFQNTAAIVSNTGWVRLGESSLIIFKIIQK